MFKKKQEDGTAASRPSSGVDLKSWSEDQYESVVVQRNILFVVCVVCTTIVFLLTLLTGKLSLSKSIQPIVVEVEEATGITSLVNPLDDKRWMSSRAVNEYFLIKYIRARETYDVASYLDMYNNTVRLMSSQNVYRQFTQVINDSNASPIAKYGSNNSTFIKVRSIQFLPSTQNGQYAQIRFAVIERSGRKAIQNKIASIIFNYLEMKLGFEDRMVNPLGFQISSYTVSEEKDV